MKNEELVRHKQDCSGCELCSTVCPKHIIEMKADDDGFYYPHIVDENLCINCNRCIDSCPISSPVNYNNFMSKSYAGYAKDDQEIKKSASGGLATELSKQFIEKYQGVVYGVKYSEDDYFDILFTRCTTNEDLETLRTSKYSQARKYQIYTQVLTDLKNGLYVLFIGLPCEVAAVRKYVKRFSQHLYTVDLICHGPTSLLVHKKYLQELLVQYNAESIHNFSVRYKKEGCKPYYIHALMDSDIEHLEQFHPSAYGVAFKYLKRPSCAHCKFKVNADVCNMPADLTIGDFHAAGPGIKAYNIWGTSQASVHNEKGDVLISLLENHFYLYNISNYKALHYNYAFRKSVKLKINRKSFIKAMNSSLQEAASLKSVSLLDFLDKCVFNMKVIIVRLVHLLKLR